MSSQPWNSCLLGTPPSSHYAPQQRRIQIEHMRNAVEQYMWYGWIIWTDEENCLDEMAF
jgi:hypothetical protein